MFDFRSNALAHCIVNAVVLAAAGDNSRHATAKPIRAEAP